MDDDALVPRELRDLPQWVGWCRKDAEPKPKKLPLNPRTSTYADPTAPNTWGTFAEACAARERYRLDGIGFISTANDPFTFIDLDGCVNPDSGAIAPWAEQLVPQLDSYTEVSPSGTGLHILIRGLLLDGKGHRCGPIEVYD